MPFLPCLLPDPHHLHVETYERDDAANRLIIHVASSQLTAQCPVCGCSTHRVHSHYERTLADLPCAQFSLILQVSVRKFFCVNSACLRRIFTERLPLVAAPWARKTVRLVQQLRTVGLALGGAAGSRLAKFLGYQSCGSTLLNLLQSLPLPQVTVPDVLGVDDFALRKGCQYGTILVDLDQHHPIALLADHTAETLAHWLQAHPGVKILSRDRAKAYKRGMTEGAPDAIQVTDRFHLVQNWSEAIDRTLRHYRAELKAVDPRYRRPPPKLSKTVAICPSPRVSISAPPRIEMNHQQRLQQQQTIQAFDQQGWSSTAIADAVGVSIRTVYRYLALPDLPATPPHRSSLGRSRLDPYYPQILEWWNRGLRHTNQLMDTLKQLGYQGSRRTLSRYLRRIRTAQGLPLLHRTPSKPSSPPVPPKSPCFTPRRAAVLMVMREEHRQPEETELLEQLRQQHPDLAQIMDLSDAFLQLLRLPQPDALDGWLQTALDSLFKPFRAFANGVLSDYAAVKASLSTTISNGPVEGLNNRLKMLKRQMYGRAGLDLLAKRLILNV